MKQRTAVAGAVTNKPDILSMDEAFALGTRILVMSRRPGTVIADFPVSYTRDFIENNSDDFRYTEDFYKKRKYMIHEQSDGSEKKKEDADL